MNICFSETAKLIRIKGMDVRSFGYMKWFL